MVRLSARKTHTFYIHVYYNIREYWLKKVHVSPYHDICAVVRVNIASLCGRGVLGLAGRGVPVVGLALEYARAPCCCLSKSALAVYGGGTFTSETHREMY